MSPLGRRRSDAEGIAPRRPHAGLLRRERRVLLKAREQAVADVGGLAIEMYRRGGFRDDLLAERCSIVVGIDARLAEIEELLHVRRNVPRCECGAPELRAVARRRPLLGGDRDRARAGRGARVTELLGERDAAIREVETRCPHCSSERAHSQAYCLDCGHALPPLTGPVARWRHRWMRRVGWYPGDWIWAGLGALVVAAAGGAAAIAVADHRDADRLNVVTALSPVALVAPSVPATGSTAPAAPRKASTGGKSNGHQVWPAGQTGWTIVLVSYP